MITLENVVKSYPNGVGAINGISLHIDRGEFVFIVGDSGSGKSTLIKLLLKELEPTEGTIRVNGVLLNRMKKRNIPKYRRKIGCVFQDFRLLKDRNVYENVAFTRSSPTDSPMIDPSASYASIRSIEKKSSGIPSEILSFTFIRLVCTCSIAA